MSLSLCRILSVVMTLLMVEVGAEAELCVGGGDNTRLSLSSWHNASDHWHATVRLERSAPMGRPSRRLTVDVEPSSWRCGATRTDAITLHVQGPTPPPPPPADYTDLSGFGLYKIHKDKKNWEEAKLMCEAEKAHLLILQSDAEAQVIKEFITRHSELSLPLHIGFIFKDDKKEHFTIFDQRLVETGYTKWRPNEPSSIGKENCGSVDENALLNDISCKDDKLSFICEYDYV